MKDSPTIADELYMEFYSAILNISRSRDCTEPDHPTETIQSLNEKFRKFIVAEQVAENSSLSVVADELQTSAVVDCVDEDELVCVMSE